MRDTILAGLTAFFVEHQYCGELDGGRDNGSICSNAPAVHTSLARLAFARRFRPTLPRSQEPACPTRQRDWTMTDRLIGFIVAAGTGLLLGGQLVIAAERIDFLDTNSNRTGYIIVDPKTKRLDTYDRQSKRTGWGTITRESGEVQV